MHFELTDLKDAWLVLLEPVHDERGFFARTFCVDEFAAHGLETSYPQHSISLSSRRGTVRGMHFQQEPHSEVKLVRCLKGAIWDVVIDIRKNSPTYCRWQAFELSGSNNRQLYIPKGFAHGFQVLNDDTVISYLISEPYVPGAASGIRYNDPAFNIAWPLEVTAISKKDQGWPDFTS
jgi:dTDP-4-dehydrorhamnose 3,5-epimerase